MSIEYNIDIDHDWKIFRPIRPAYKNDKYICKVINYKSDNIYPLRENVLVMLAGSDPTKSRLNMHLTNITIYKLENRTYELLDDYKKMELDKRFLLYKNKWITNKILNKAKALLSR